MGENTYHLSINGMTCGGCSSRLTRVLMANEHITGAEISHESDSGIITASENMSIGKIIQLINAAGFTAKS